MRGPTLRSRTVFFSFFFIRCCAQSTSSGLNKTVSLPPGFAARATHQLVVNGLDYNASFYLNGERVGDHAGPYLTGRIDLDLRSLLGPAVVSATTDDAQLEIAVCGNFAVILDHSSPGCMLSSMLSSPRTRRVACSTSCHSNHP